MAPFVWLLMVLGSCEAPCAGAGDWVDGGKSRLAACCEGLVASPTYDLACQATSGPDAGQCIPCGDGVCGRLEDGCSCPEDCG